MKRVYELDVHKLAEELSDMVWHDFDRWNKKVQTRLPTLGTGGQNTVGYQIIRSTTVQKHKGQISNFYFLISTFRERFQFLSCLLMFFMTCFFSIWSCNLEVEAGSYPVSVSMKPDKIPLGGIALATIKINDKIKLLDVKFLGKKIPYHLDPSNQDYFVLIGAGLDCKPGTHILTVKWQGPDGPHDLYSHEVRVMARTFPEERLSVPERMVEFPPKILERVLNDQKAVKETCNKISNNLYWKRPFIWPVNSKILSQFGFRRIFNNKPRSPHSGVDLRAPEGTPILASNYGKVTMARDCYLSGKTVVLDHGKGLYTLYAHLVSYKVSEGQEVERGQVVGLAGSTGRATGPHLHWGVSLLGKRLDPEELMALLGT